MRGVSGIANIGDRDVLEQMTAVQAHRGPDDAGVWEFRSPDGTYVGLGSPFAVGRSAEKGNEYPRLDPLAIRLKAFLQEVHEPLALHYWVNAGQIPRDHWINHPTEGGGRLVGEVCHFIDFCTFLLGSFPLAVETRNVANGEYAGDNVIIALDFPDGSQATITYVANGDKSYSKERFEVFGGGVVAVLEDFRRLELVRRGQRRVFRHLLAQDKGHIGEWKAFSNAILAGRESPIAFGEIVTSTLAILRAAESRARGARMEVRTAGFQSPGGVTVAYAA